MVVGGVSAVGLVGGLGWALATGGGGTAQAAASAGGSASSSSAHTSVAPAAPATTTSATTSTSSTPAGLTVAIVGYGSQLCVTVPNDAGTSPLTLQQCGAGASQLFTLTASGAGYTLTDQASGACVDNGASTADGTPIGQAGCSGATSQTWIVQQQTGGDGQEYRVIDWASNLCLDAYGAATSAGTTLDQWPCKSNPFQDGNQVWRLVRQ